MSDDGGARAKKRRTRSRKRRRHEDEPARDDAASSDDPADAGSETPTRDAGDSEADDARPKKRRRKKKKRASPPGGDDRRPTFARGYPRHDRLDRLVTAFDRGDFALVRAEAPALIEGDEDEAVKRAATDLRRRIDPAPTSVFLWALGVALLVFLYGFYVSHTH